MRKITIQELDLAIASKELSGIDDFKILHNRLHVNDNGHWTNFPLDANFMLDIQKRDCLWPRPYVMSEKDYYIRINLKDEYIPKLIICASDPLTCVKLAYAKLHGLFDGEDLEVE